MTTIAYQNPLQSTTGRFSAAFFAARQKLASVVRKLMPQKSTPDWTVYKPVSTPAGHALNEIFSNPSTRATAIDALTDSGAYVVVNGSIFDPNAPVEVKLTDGNFQTGDAAARESLGILSAVNGLAEVTLAALRKHNVNLAEASLAA